MWTITEFYKLKKQILQTFILPLVMCKQHSAGEILSVTDVQKSKKRLRKGGLALNTPQLYSAGYLVRNFFKSHFFPREARMA